jgi:hypothetical protein
MVQAFISSFPLCVECGEEKHDSANEKRTLPRFMCSGRYIQTTMCNEFRGFRNSKFGVGSRYLKTSFSYPY